MEKVFNPRAKTFRSQWCNWRWKLQLFGQPTPQRHTHNETNGKKENEVEVNACATTNANAKWGEIPTTNNGHSDAYRRTELAEGELQDLCTFQVAAQDV